MRNTPRSSPFDASPDDTVTRLSRDDDVAATLQRLEAIAKVMDTAVRIPGTQVVMGLDAVLGLLPIVGDAIASAVGGYLIWEARRLGASRFTLLRMAANTTLDTVLGSVPVLGDVFDVAYKANRKNVALLRAHLEKHGRRDPNTIETSYRVETV